MMPLASSTITNNAALVYNLYGPESYSGAISGSGSVRKTGGGILTLSGLNTYGGGTTVMPARSSRPSPGPWPGFGTASKVAVANNSTLTLRHVGMGGK